MPAPAPGLSKVHRSLSACLRCVPCGRAYQTGPAINQNRSLPPQSPAVNAGSPQSSHETTAHTAQQAVSTAPPARRVAHQGSVVASHRTLPRHITGKPRHAGNRQSPLPVCRRAQPHQMQAPGRPSQAGVATELNAQNLILAKTRTAPAPGPA